MKKIKYITISIFIIICLIFAYLFYNNTKITTIQSSNDKNCQEYVQLKNTSKDPKKIYSEDYQNDKLNQIENAINQNSYTLKQPLLIENPYGTNTTGIYMYFKTEKMAKATYTISCEGYADFTRTLNTNTSSGYTKEHEYLLVGAIPNQKNTITVNLFNQQGDQIDTISWTYDAPNLLGGNEYITVDLETTNNTTPLTNGLYTVLGNDVDEDSDVLAYTRLYDNSGVIRSEIPITSYRAHRMIFNENTMYLSISGTKIVGIDQTGYVSAIYDTGDYKLHHDYIFNDDQNFIVLASKKDAKTSEDKIITIDRETGEINELIDLIDLFPNYYKTTSKPKSEDDIDWMHINSLHLVNGNSLIISSRETSTIIKIDDIYNNPTVDYMIGSDNFWQDSGYDNLLLTPINDFSLQAGQHCVTYVEDATLAKGQYYLYLYNNNIAVSSTRPNYDWKTDDNYDNVAYNAKEGTSYYYKYLIDENNRTVELVDEFPVLYSGYVSSVQEIDNNIVIDSGMSMSWAEYDEFGNLITRYKTIGGTFLYRVLKYDYLNYWFQ